MSSSNRTALPCDAYLERDDRPAGPLRLPRKNKVAFIAEFNRRYYSAGLTLQEIVVEDDDQDKPVSGPSPQ